MLFEISLVNPEAKLVTEQLGKKTKYWYRDTDDRKMLFKAEERGIGEDWAEKAVCEIAALLGIPHVHYELAIEEGSQTPGVICESCATDPEWLVLGNEVLAHIDDSYPVEGTASYRTSEHTVQAVAEVMQIIDPPGDHFMADVPDGIVSALDVFSGYIMLDALVGNTDRHHQNWGVLFGGPEVRLAPSFDHGASLARQLSDEERRNRLETADAGYSIPAFARRARSALHARSDERRPLTTHDAWLWYKRFVREAAESWLGQLESVDEAIMNDILEKLPPQRMSPVCRRFTLELLSANRQRLLADEE